MKTSLAVVGALIAAFSTLPYLIDIVNRKTKPNIVSWLTWTMLAAIVTGAAFAAHEQRTAILTLGGTICTGAVVVLGLKYGIAKYSLFDALCQAGAVTGLLLWLIFNSPTIGIVMSVLVDLVGALPTVRHAWLKPGEETWQTFLIGIFAATFTILSLTRYNIPSLLYPAYIVLANAAIATIVVSRRLQLGIKLSRKTVHETLHE